MKSDSNLFPFRCSQDSHALCSFFSAVTKQENEVLSLSLSLFPRLINDLQTRSLFYHGPDYNSLSLFRFCVLDLPLSLSREVEKKVEIRRERSRALSRGKKHEREMKMCN